MPIITGGDPPRGRKGTKRGNPIRAQKAAEMLRRALEELTREIKETTKIISAQIAGGATPAQVARTIEQRLKQANQKFEAASDRLATRMVGKISEDNKDRIERMLQNTLGIDIVKIIDSDAVREQIQQAVADNVRLIRTIPEEHFSKIAQAVSDNYRGLQFKEGSLANRLKRIGKITDTRAKLIARDQTAKLVTSLNATRQQEAGIEGYIWRNQGDIRVVGNPSGLYPKGNPQHQDHWQREGKVFKWSEPPPDGHPGQAINCRCFAEPIVNIKAIQDNALRI